MKTYNKPNTVTLFLSMENIIATSGKYGDSMGKNDTGGSGVDLSREKSGGFGSGMWEDMK